MKIDRDDSADLDFVIQCLMTGAIDVPELRQWAMYAIEQLPQPPLWLFDLADFDQAAFHVYDVFGFYPGGSDADPKAVAGVACKRGRRSDVTINDPANSVAALARHPTVAQRFNSTFPFLTPVSA